ncbi:MAG: tetratricopeptide repeat protein [Anaerolineales bacterium]|jgi:tetratricopeptide (TPR) repeat protein|nr:tetratricopeptide repeat protein [Anaerolineales bacterium]
MQKRRKPLNLFNIFVLIALIGAAFYFERTIVPNIPIPGAQTATPTRDPESYVSEAEGLFREGKLAKAIEAYQSALQANPSDAATYLTMARIQVFLGRYEDAQVSAENALLLTPNNATGYAVRGWALASQGDFLAGEAAITRALEIEPNNALAHAYYAELLADQYVSGSGPLNIIEKMTEESRVALSLGQGTLEAHRARGYVLEVTQNFPEAIAEYETAVAINNNIADLHLSLGRAYWLQGIYDKAFDSLNRSNALNPADPVPDFLISRIYLTTGEYGKAEQYAQQAIADNPQNTAYYGHLGTIQYRNFKWPEAVESFSYVIKGGLYNDEIQVEPLALTAGRAAEYYYMYGFTLLRLNRCNEAVPIFQKIVTAVPGDEDAVYNATEGLRQCAESLNNPAVPGEAAEETTTAEAPQETLQP